MSVHQFKYHFGKIIKFRKVFNKIRHRNPSQPSFNYYQITQLPSNFYYRYGKISGPNFNHDDQGITKPTVQGNTSKIGQGSKLPINKKSTI